MSDAKKGLRLLSFAIILNIGWSIAASFLRGSSNADLVKYLPVITLGILLVCYLVDFAGLRIAGHDSDYFATAWKLKIFTLLCTLVAIIFAVVVAAKDDPELRKTLATVVMIVDIISLVSEVLVLIYVIKGCREIAPRVEGLSKFVGGLFFMQTLLIIVMEVASYLILKNDIPVEETTNPVIMTAAITAIIFSVLAIAFLVLYIFLIFRTTANVGKSKRR